MRHPNLTRARRLRGGYVLALSLGVAAVPALSPTPAAACGCFAPPDVSVPIVQAGERIVFAQKDGEVIAHIQIQYQGKPADFGWLLPLPAIPKDRNGSPGIDVSTDELFNVLSTGTQPLYRTSLSSDCVRNDDASYRPTWGCGAQYAAGEVSPRDDVGNGADAGLDGPLVVQSSIGPYEFAVLKADNKDEMLAWLLAKGYVVPAGSDTAVAPYIRPGAFFLALRLRAGQSTGDLQPVVLRYQADLPMIPIILTQVAATRNMGVQVFLLGAGRGIPRNYRHVVLNEGQLDWYKSAANYNDVVIRAVAEATDRHAFVTEYAGTSNVVTGQLDRPGRFAILDQIKNESRPNVYISSLLQAGQGFVTLGSGSRQPASGQLIGVLERHVPLPAALRAEGVTPWVYYSDISLYLITDRQRRPAVYADIEAKLAAFNPMVLTQELRDRIVVPTEEAGALLRAYPYLTRLYTTLSPEDMTADPVFSFNRDLPDVSNVHDGGIVQHCDASATLFVGDQFQLPASAQSVWPQQGKFSRRIEILRETGAPVVEVDNPPAPPPIGVNPQGDDTGCATTSGRPRALAPLGPVGLVLGALAALVARRRRRARREDLAK